jgi:hypothetical protein
LGIDDIRKLAETSTLLNDPFVEKVWKLINGGTLFEKSPDSLRALRRSLMRESFSFFARKSERYAQLFERADVDPKSAGLFIQPSLFHSSLDSWKEAVQDAHPACPRKGHDGPGTGLQCSEGKGELHVAHLNRRFGHDRPLLQHREGKRGMGFSPIYDLRTGLEETVDWYRVKGYI